MGLVIPHLKRFLIVYSVIAGTPIIISRGSTNIYEIFRFDEFATTGKKITIICSNLILLLLRSIQISVDVVYDTQNYKKAGFRSKLLLLQVKHNSHKYFVFSEREVVCDLLNGDL